MIAAIDTNVLLDVLLKDQKFHTKSRKTLEELSEEGFFIISPEVYTELLAAFSQDFENPGEQLDSFLDDKSISMENHDRDSLRIAGEKWREYDASQDVRCASCGEARRVECEECGGKISWRNHVITDFMIGGHAQHHADILVTRDRGYFGKYFDVEINDPGDG
ncbi:MAG: type II toxin-antitoxin system VapC family toxin [Candidatus Aenigmatarchaeota archaeon]